jgi:integrase
MRYGLTQLKLKRKTKPGRHGDGGGLYLAVSPNGAKSWIFMWKKSGKRHAMGLGSYPTLSLLEAREEAIAARKAVAKGENPKAARNARKAGTLTFAEAAEKCITATGGGWSYKHRNQWQASLGDKYVATLKPMAVNTISTDDVLKVLAPIWQDKHVTAKRIRSRIEIILDWAKAKGHRTGENPARWRGHMSNLLPKRKHAVTHLTAMAYQDVPDLVATLRLQDRVAARALEFLILTAARTAEVTNALWSEIEGDVWTIPAERMKGNRQHVVPLSDRCLEILQQQKERLPSRFVFPSAPDRPMYHDGLLELLRELRDEPTVHGMRSAFRMWAAERGYPRELAELCLAHRIGSVVEQSYQRSTLLEQRRRIMQDWTNFCTSPATGKVVGMRGRRAS